MKYDLIIRPEAEQDLRGAFGWYEDRVSGLGREFLCCVDAAIAQINRAPATHPVIYQDIRRILIRRFPFGIFYIVTGQKIIVLAVLHARRDPSLWQKRKFKS
jgi:toxin ParE1/3/4